MTALARAGHHPFRLGGTALPPNLVLCAKLIIACLLIKGYVGRLPEPFLPLIPAFDAIPWPPAFRRALQASLLLGSAGVLFNVRVRTACLLAALPLLIGPLSARATYTNGQFFCGSILLLISLHHGRHMIWLLRAQLVVMYFGSGLNKLLEPDWHDGVYMDYWLGTIRRSSIYALLAPHLPHMVLATLMGWGSIVTELGLSVALAIPRLVRAAVWVAIVFHGVSVLFANEDFSVFFGALLAAFLVFVDWPTPRSVTIQYRPEHRFDRALRAVSDRISLEETFVWQPSGEPEASRPRRLTLTLHGRTYHGIAAVNCWILLQPLTYALLLLLVVVDWRPLLGLRWDREWIRDWTIVLGTAWFFPLTAWALERARRATAS